MLTCSLVALALSTVAAAQDPVPPLDQVTQILVFPRHGWILTFSTDGSVHAQYGSLPGDGASLPAGTVKFDALLAAVRRLQAPKKVRDDTQVGVHRKGKSTATAFYLSDDTLFRFLVASFQDKWRPDGDRFRGLLDKYPIYAD